MPLRLQLTFPISLQTLSTDICYYSVFAFPDLSWSYFHLQGLPKKPFFWALSHLSYLPKAIEFLLILTPYFNPRVDLKNNSITYHMHSSIRRHLRLPLISLCCWDVLYPHSQQRRIWRLRVSSNLNHVCLKEAEHKRWWTVRKTNLRKVFHWIGLPIHPNREGVTL